ncbi:MAG: hypothetical protein EP332_12405 [Bacteroidetes bacterium]|nr:MAG: hypothetical protein EP332_12405 [Bacteroidota bacterium]
MNPLKFLILCLVIIGFGSQAKSQSKLFVSAKTQELLKLAPQAKCEKCELVSLSPYVGFWNIDIQPLSLPVGDLKVRITATLDKQHTVLAKNQAGVNSVHKLADYGIEANYSIDFKLSGNYKDPETGNTVSISSYLTLHQGQSELEHTILLPGVFGSKGLKPEHKSDINLFIKDFNVQITAVEAVKIRDNSWAIKLDNLLKQERLKQAKEQAYQAAISNAQRLEKAGKLDEAIQAYKEADALKPSKEIQAKIDSLRTKQREKTSQKTDSSQTAKPQDTTANSATTDNPKSSTIPPNSTASTSQQTNSAGNSSTSQTEAERRQAAYDEWKENAIDYQEKRAIASTAATAGLLYYLGGFIYRNMGKVYGSESVYNPTKEWQLFLNLDFGYSGTVAPILYPFESTGMISGTNVSRRGTDAATAFTVNLEGNFNLGIEHQNFMARGTFNMKFGTSPLFNGIQSSAPNGGLFVAGGAKSAKAFVQYGIGPRTLSYRSLEVEKTGKGRSEILYSRFILGLNFTTNPNKYLVRNHIQIGFIRETIRPNGFDQGLFNPINGQFEGGEGWSNPINGLSLSWKKERHFNFYFNYYPKYWYSGIRGGKLNSELEKGTTAAFVEFGFLRSIDGFMSFK